MFLPRTQPIRRLTQLYAGLVLYGLSCALMVRARLGLDPWDVLHQGLSHHIGLAIGTCAIIVGIAVLLLWIPLRQLPGLGTVSNAALIGLVMNAALDLLPAPDGIAPRLALLLGGVFLNGVATGCYIGAGLGPGPRDGLMTGIAARGHSLRIVRTCIEVTVLATGWILGGTVGLGTVVYALAIGPLAHVFIPLGRRGIRPEPPRGTATDRATDTGTGTASDTATDTATDTVTDTATDTATAEVRTAPVV